MDIRTWVVPHSSIVTKENLVTKDKDEMSNVEAKKKVDKGAVLKVLAETGKGVVRFLQG